MSHNDKINSKQSATAPLAPTSKNWNTHPSNDELRRHLGWGLVNANWSGNARKSGAF